MNDKLVRKTVRGDKFTTATVAMVGQQVQSRIDADRYDDALTAHREVNAKYTPADKATADAWLKLSGTAMNGYEAKLLPDRMKPWAELRIPPLEGDLDALRKTKPTELALLRDAEFRPRLHPVG